MPIQLLKSEIDKLSKSLGVDFLAALEQHRQAKLAHRFDKPHQKTGVGSAAPMPIHPIMDNLLLRVRQGDDKPDDFVPAFEIIDDSLPEAIG